MSSIQLHGLVLAGGMSSRMGRDKACLELGQQTYLQTAVAALEPLCDRVWVSGDYPDWPCIGDLDWLKERQLRGPLAGIYSVLSQLADTTEVSGLLVIPVDMPLLDQAHLEQLQRQVQRQPDRACYLSESQFPLYLPRSQAVGQTLLACLTDPQPRQRSLRTLLTRLEAVALEPLDPARLINVNTPAQHQALVDLREN